MGKILIPEAFLVMMQITPRLSQQQAQAINYITMNLMSVPILLICLNQPNCITLHE